MSIEIFYVMLEKLIIICRTCDESSCSKHVISYVWVFSFGRKKYKVIYFMLYLSAKY